MLSRVRSGIGCVSLALLLPAMLLWAEPQQKEAGAAPVPAQIMTAKKVFISNAGGGCSPFGQVGFSGGADHPYNQFYAAMKGWDRYELSTSPADADLNFEISFSCPAGGTSVVKGQSLGAAYDPQLRLVIMDIRTHVVLWGITEHVEVAILQSNRDKNFNAAMNRMVADLKDLTARPAPAPGGASNR